MIRRYFTLLSIGLVLLGCKSRNSDDCSISNCVPDTFSLSFYNVENMFDLKYDGLEYAEYIPGSSNWDIEMQRKKVENIASVLAEMGADVVSLCEVENENALRDLKNALKTKGLHYPYSAIGDQPVKTITCTAVLSKYPLVNTRVIPVYLPGKAKTRNILEADILICDKKLKLFVNHWPSKRSAESFRLKAAEVLFSRLKELENNVEYVIVGDLNSDYDEYSKLRTFGMDDTRGKTGINNILGTVKNDGKSIRFLNEKELKQQDACAHYDLWLEISESLRRSYVFKGNPQTPDHILLPATLYDSTGFSYVDNSFEVFTWDGQLLKNNMPFRWSMRYRKKRKLHTGYGYSDHLPLIARFVRGSFRFSSSSLHGVNEKNYCEGREEGFECSTEGWMSCHSGIEVKREASNTKSGFYCLQISAGARKSNITAGRVVLEKKVQGNWLKFEIKGSGKICFRVRARGGKWAYYNASEFKNSRSASYKEVNFLDWQQFSLRVDDSIRGDLEFEVRAGRGSPFCVWLDNVQW